jgi:hypothetical protein
MTRVKELANDRIACTVFVSCSCLVLAIYRLWTRGQQVRVALLSYVTPATKDSARSSVR